MSAWSLVGLLILVRVAEDGTCESMACADGAADDIGAVNDLGATRDAAARRVPYARRDGVCWTVQMRCPTDPSMASASFTPVCGDGRQSAVCGNRGRFARSEGDGDWALRRHRRRFCGPSANPAAPSITFARRPRRRRHARTASADDKLRCHVLPRSPRGGRRKCDCWISSWTFARRPSRRRLPEFSRHRRHARTASVDQLTLPVFARRRPGPRCGQCDGELNFDGIDVGSGVRGKRPDARCRFLKHPSTATATLETASVDR